MRGGERDAAVHARGGELSVEVGLVVAKDGDADMADAGVVGHRPLALGERVVVAQDEREPVVGVEFAARAGRKRGGGGGEGEVESAGFYPGHDVGTVRLDADRDARRLAGKPRHEGRGEQDAVRVRSGDADGALHLQGIKARLLEDRLHMIQRDGEAACKLLGAWA